MFVPGNSGPQRTVADKFPSWRSATAVPKSLIWQASTDWTGNSLLESLFELLDEEMQETVPDIDRISEIGKNIIIDIQYLFKKSSEPHILIQLDFFQFYLSTLISEYAMYYGRFLLIYEWLFQAVAHGELIISHGKLFQWQPAFHRITYPFYSEHPAIQNRRGITLLRWAEALFYLARRWFTLNEIMDAPIPRYDGSESGTSIHEWLFAGMFETLEDKQIELSEDHIRTACQMLSWAVMYRPELAKRMSIELSRVYNLASISQEAKKHIGITLSGISIVGEEAAAKYARRTLDECTDVLVAHERLQLILYLYAAKQNYEQYLTEVREEMTECVHNTNEVTSGGHAFIYSQNQIFVILIPLLRHFYNKGDSTTVLDLLCAWYGVGQPQRRVSPVLICEASNGEGAVCAFGGKKIEARQDQSELWAYTIDRTNRELSQVITRDTRINEGKGEPSEEQKKGWSSLDFEQVLNEYYKISNFSKLLGDLSKPTGIVQLQALPHPLQALTLRNLGQTWPFVVSFAEPEKDRKNQKVLLWTVGTKTGSSEVTLVEAYLRSKGTSVQAMNTIDLDSDAFKALYTSSEYDVVWIAAHGYFRHDAPHLSTIQLSDNENEAELITVADLVDCKQNWDGRRLLVVNVCFSGTAWIAQSPPKLGIGPMLATKKQAVISHLWGVEESAALAFGLLLAIGLVEEGQYFPGFCYALEKLGWKNMEIRKEIEQNYAGLEVRELAAASKIIQGLPTSELKIWGSPVFYE